MIALMANKYAKINFANIRSFILLGDRPYYNPNINHEIFRSEHTELEKYIPEKKIEHKQHHAPIRIVVWSNTVSSCEEIQTHKSPKDTTL